MYLLILTTCISIGQTQFDDYYMDYNNLQLPKTPNGASFATYGNTPVDLSTGIPQISIPIYTLEVDGVQVPISLSYHASGVLADELATAVGLKWTLNAGGGIYRTINGKPDEEGWLNSSSSFIPTSHYNLPQNTNQWQTLTGSMATARDHNPDEFSYNFLNYSNSYFHAPESSLKIKADIDNISIWGDYALIPNNNSTFLSATDDLGNTFKFGDNNAHEISANVNTYASLPENGLPTYDGYDYDPYITGWMLNEIVTKNNSIIKFEYEQYDLSYHWAKSAQNLTVSNVASNGYGKESYTSTTHTYENQLIKKIYIDEVEILFSYSTNTNLSLWQRQLDKITITDRIQGNSKEFHFVYGTFTGDARLKLLEVYEKSNGVQKPSYKFTYNTGPLPEKNKYYKDFYGYYNGTSGDRHSLVPLTGFIQTTFNMHQQFLNQHIGNRTLSESHLKHGVLEKIEYPTGGFTEFVYEANKEVVNGNDKYMGGLRVKEIHDLDDSNEYHKKIYEYEGLNGIDLNGNEIYTMRNANTGYAPSFYSSFVAPGHLAIKGFFYDKVTVNSYSGQTLEYKEVSNYIGKPDGWKFRPVLKNKQYYNSSNALVKIDEYEYQSFGTADQIQWNIMADKELGMIDGNWGLIFVTGWNMTRGGNTSYLTKQLATTEFLDKGGSTMDPVTTVTIYDYNTTTAYKINEVINTKLVRAENTPGTITYDLNDANGDLIDIDYEYVSDYPSEPTLNTLPDGLPVSKKVERNTLKILGQFFEYDADGNIKAVYKHYRGSGSHSGPGYIDSDYQRVMSFLSNDGSPTQVQKENGIYTAYIWDSTNTYLLAEVVNATYASASSYLNITLDMSTLSDTQISNEIDLIRQGLPNAQVTTYIHEPLAGVIQITDPKGYTFTYEYDELNRLKYVKDADDNLVSKNEYNYKN